MNIGSFQSLLQSKGQDKFLEDEVFEKVVFDEFELNPTIGAQIFLRNITFDRCRVAPYSCGITGDTTLENVVFNNLDCGGAMRIGSDNVFMRGVVIKGRKPRALYIRPSIDTEDSKSRQFSYPDYDLDISEYQGKDVDIIGINVDGVKINPDRHVKLKLDRFENVNWEEMGFVGFSMWISSVQRIESWRAKEAIMSLPTKRDKSYQIEMEELAILRQHGLVD